MKPLLPWSRPISVAALALCVLWIGSATEILHASTPPYTVKFIRAFLFFNGRGGLSPNIIDNPIYSKPWNVIIGPDASQETLVVVEVSGKPQSYEVTRKVELQVTEGKKMKFRRASEIGVINVDGRYFAPFMLYDTGCAPVRLLARIIGQPQPSRLEKTINFRCGE